MNRGDTNRAPFAKPWLGVRDWSNCTTTTCMLTLVRFPLRGMVKPTRTFQMYIELKQLNGADET